MDRSSRWLAIAGVALAACASTPEAPAPPGPEQEPEAATSAAAPAGVAESAFGVDSVVVQPQRIEVRVGEAYPLSRLNVTLLDAAGQTVEDVPVMHHLQSRVATIEGEAVRAHRAGEAELILLVPQVATDARDDFPPFGRVTVVVTPEPVASVEIDAGDGRVYVNAAERLEARAVTSRGDVRDDVRVRWSSDHPEILTVDALGFVHAERPGRATVTAAVDDARARIPIEVVTNPVRIIDLTPALSTVRTGDVVRFRAIARDADGAAVEDVPITFAILGGGPRAGLGASVYPDGAFVAADSGVYRVTASAGPVAAHAVVEAEPREVEMTPVLVGQGIISHHPTSDLWVFEGVDGRDYAYTGTHVGGQNMYAWDVTDPVHPVLTDSVVVDARVVNDVKVNEAGTLAVITREGASNRRNGLVVLDLADPAHPTILSEYTETLTGGVHNTFIVDDLVYAIHDGTLDVHIIDISEPSRPRQVGRWGIDRPGKTLHDIWIQDGLAYVSYWNDGMWVLDVGDGRWGGTPTEPEPVSHIAYPEGNTHVAFPYTNEAGNTYVFVGDEIFGCEECISRAGTHEEGPRGFVHVVSLDDPEHPVEVGRYEVPEAGVHNLWVEDDKLYAAYYQGGLRVVDISGELRGNLYQQGREIAWFPTGSPVGYRPNSPFAWGPQPYKGNIFVSDYNSGLWVIRLQPKQREVFP